MHADFLNTLLSQNEITSFFNLHRIFDALSALALLDEAHCDITLSELAMEWKRSQRNRHPTGAQDAEPMTIRDLFERHLEHYGKEQVFTRRHQRQSMLALCRAMGPDFPVAALRWNDIEAALGHYGNARTYNGHVRALGTALRWAQRAGLLPETTPLRDGVQLPLHPETFSEPTYFPPEKVEKIMRTVEQHPGTVATGAGVRLSLGFFAGVRSVEIQRGRWEDLDLEGGTLRIPRPKGWTRGQKPRIVELERNATAWLGKWRDWTAKRRGGGPPRGPMTPGPTALFTKWKKMWLAPAGLSWGRNDAANVMRHTYATMHVGAFRNAPATALNLGHGDSTRMLERHYMGLVRKLEAERYWKIMPEAWT